MDRHIRTVEDMLRLLDGLFTDTGLFDGSVACASDRAREAGVRIDFRCGEALVATCST